MDEPRRRETAGAWAAAAVVLALGALAFGVSAQFRISDLESRIAEQPGVSETTAKVTTTLRGSSAPVPQSSVPPSSDDIDGSPADPVAAESAVREAFAAVYAGASSVPDRLVRIDDPSGVAAAIGRAAVGEFGTQLTISTTQVDQVAFTSPTTADVIYSVLAGPEALVNQALGSSRLVDGVWKVTRATVCGDLERVGAPCR